MQFDQMCAGGMRQEKQGCGKIDPEHLWRSYDSRGGGIDESTGLYEVYDGFDVRSGERAFGATHESTGYIRQRCCSAWEEAPTSVGDDEELTAADTTYTSEDIGSCKKPQPQDSNSQYEDPLTGVWEEPEEQGYSEDPPTSAEYEPLEIKTEPERYCDDLLTDFIEGPQYKQTSAKPYGSAREIRSAGPRVLATLERCSTGDDNVKREINQLTRKLDSRIDDYRGVRNSIAGINSNTGNLYNANTYLDKKRGKLEEKTRKLERFKRALTDFNSHAESVDKEVANEIKASTKAFCREHGLGYGVFYTLGVWIGDGVKWLKNSAEKVVSSVVNWAKDKLEEIKDFYERNKYLIEFVVDLVVTAAAIITFAAALSATIISGGAGIPLLLAATWGLMKAGASTLYSGAALSAHNSGDDALAEELSGKGMKDVMQYCRTKYWEET